MDPDHATDRLSALLDQLISDGSDPVILVAQIINAADQATESRIQTFNQAVPGIVDRCAKAGHKVMVVDMRSITAADLKDGLHPTDAGYQKMADLWFKAIQQADANGWIKAPKTPRPNLDVQGHSSGQHCLQPPFWAAAFSDDKKPIATGVGHDGDMKFKDNWDGKLNAAPSIGKVGTGVVFADLNGDGECSLRTRNRASSDITYLRPSRLSLRQQDYWFRHRVLEHRHWRRDVLGQGQRWQGDCERPCTAGACEICRYR